MRVVVVWSWLVLAVAGCGSEQKVPSSPASDARAPRALFDGRSLAGFEVVGHPEAFGVEEGGILAIKKPGEGHLRSRESFADFELSFEYRLDGGADSGVFFRWEGDGAPETAALEFQLTDGGGPGGLDLGSNGGLYGLAAPGVEAGRPAGEWIPARLRVVGTRVTAEIDGRPTLDIDLAAYTAAGRNPDGSQNPLPTSAASHPRRGRLGFANQRFFAWFREIRVTPLGP